MSERPVRFSALTVFSAEGARVGIATCERCGAAILYDQRESFDAADRHREWHEARDDA
jgi:hypothetical protein